MFTLSQGFFQLTSQSTLSNQMINPINSTNDMLSRKVRMINYGIYYRNWYQNQTSNHLFGSASFIIPVSSLFILSLVILLMVLFKRCPQLIAAIVAGILGTIIIFTILVTLNHPTVYE